MSFVLPCLKLFNPAIAIITPLSVQRLIGGIDTGKWEFDNNWSLKILFAATPPTRTIPLHLNLSAALIVLVTNTSTTESWKALEKLDGISLLGKFF